MCFAVVVDCLGFSVGWFGGVGSGSFRLHQILPQQVSCSGFREVDFEALGSVASVWQLSDSGGIGYTIPMLEPTSVANTAERGAAKPNVEKAMGSSTALSDRCDNLPV